MAVQNLMSEINLQPHMMSLKNNSNLALLVHIHMSLYSMVVLTYVCIYLHYMTCWLSHTKGLVTLEEMKERQEILVKAREKQIAAKLASKTL